MYFPRMRSLRKEAHKTQLQLADYLHISQATYSGYESGKLNVSIEVLLKLCDYYGVSLDYLTGRTDERKEDR